MKVWDQARVKLATNCYIGPGSHSPGIKVKEYLSPQLATAAVRSKTIGLDKQ